MNSHEYNKQYVTLKSRLRKLRSKYFSNSLNGATLAIISRLDTVAKELDTKYYDGHNLEEIEFSLETFEDKILVR